MSMYGVIGNYDPSYLLADPMHCNKIAISVEPGNGVVARGTVMYRKDSGMYAPAAAGDVVATNDLVVIDSEVDSDADVAIAEDAAAYRRAHLITGRVLLADGTAIAAEQAIVLRMQGIVCDPMDDWTKDEQIFDNEKG